MCRSTSGGKGWGKNCLSSWQNLRGCGCQEDFWGDDRLLILEDVAKVKFFLCVCGCIIDIQ